MNKYVIPVGAAVFGILLVGLLYVIFDKPMTEKNSVKFMDGSVVSVEIADDNAERSEGLSNRKYLASNQGMLFKFDQQHVLQFWMKDTLIPLDIIFVNSNYRIVHIVERMEPCKTDECTVYSSEVPSKYAIEVNYGFVSAHGIKVGDRVIVS